MTLDATQLSGASRAVTVSRVIDAPADLLFECHSTPEHLMKWFGPEDYPVTMCELDFRVGGKWRMSMTAPDGTQNTPFGGTILEIIPGRLIRYDNAFEEEGAERMVMCFRFDPQPDGKTLLSVETTFPTHSMWDSHVGQGMVVGLGSALDQLEALAVGMKAA